MQSIFVSIVIYMLLTSLSLTISRLSSWYTNNIKSFFFSNYDTYKSIKIIYFTNQPLPLFLNYNNILLFFISFLFFWLVFTAFRSTLPRVRLDQLLDFFWKYLIAYSLLIFALGLLFMLNFKKLSFILTKLHLKNSLNKVYLNIISLTLKSHLLISTWLLTSRFSYYYIFLLNIKNI